MRLREDGLNRVEHIQAGDTAKSLQEKVTKFALSLTEEGDFESFVDELSTSLEGEMDALEEDTDSIAGGNEVFIVNMPRESEFGEQTDNPYYGGKAIFPTQTALLKNMKRGVLQINYEFVAGSQVFTPPPRAATPAREHEMAPELRRAATPRRVGRTPRRAARGSAGPPS